MEGIEQTYLNKKSPDNSRLFFYNSLENFYWQFIFQRKIVNKN
jgi:hypothetical protein